MSEVFGEGFNVAVHELTLRYFPDDRAVGMYWIRRQQGLLATRARAAPKQRPVMLSASTACPHLVKNQSISSTIPVSISLPTSISPKYVVMEVRKQLATHLPTLLVLTTLMMLWKFLALISNTNHPLMVVFFESVEPAFQRGDIVFFSEPQRPIETGEIPVLWFPGRPLPMVHRAIDVWCEGRGDVDEKKA